MQSELRDAHSRYNLMLDVLASEDGQSFTRHETMSGVPIWDASNSHLSSAFLCVVGDACSITIAPGENGLTVRDVKLLNASRAVVTAVVTPGSEAPDWLPNESQYLLFDGDRASATTMKDRYIPLCGMTRDPEVDTDGRVPLDRLAIAIGRSVARANASLARSRAEAGVALVSAITVRLHVDQTDLGEGRVLVTLARSGQDASGQFVEFTMSTVPGADPATPPEE